MLKVLYEPGMPPSLLHFQNFHGHMKHAVVVSTFTPQLPSSAATRASAVCSVAHNVRPLYPIAPGGCRPGAQERGLHYAADAGAQGGLLAGGQFVQVPLACRAHMQAFCSCCKPLQRRNEGGLICALSRIWKPDTGGVECCTSRQLASVLAWEQCTLSCRPCQVHWPVRA
jgi:hypothetical protein